jgi:MFS transporter, DHA3 family, macrolide efflux protein
MTPPDFARRPSGMTAFIIVWLGQLFSVLATNMVGFALTIWVFERTGSVTALALQGVFFITPFLIISPFAGAMVDRYNRKLMMMVSDMGAGVATIAILILNAAGVLEVWHLWAAAVVSGTCQAFQWPAYSASISLMVPKEHYARANGLMSLAEMGPGVLAPLLGGALLAVIGLTGILVIDIFALVLALSALLLVHVPQPTRSEAGRQAQGNIIKEAVFGFDYILKRRSLLALQLVFLSANFFAGIGGTLLAPIILARTGNDAAIFGTVQSVGALGGILGGAGMSAWGGFKRRVHGVLLGWFLTGLAGQALLGLGQGLPLWLVAVFAGGMLIPIVNASNQAIWQAKVEPDLQGRVFAIRRLIAWMTTPITPIIAGLLSDRLLEPGMQAGGALVPLFGGLVGSGPGAGMAVLLVATGLATAMVAIVAYTLPVVRDAEILLPDHDAASAGPAGQPAPGAAD